MLAEKTRILLVDDDKDIILSLRKGLEHKGIEVDGFSDSIEALRHIENGCKDCKVIVSDIRMPNLNGFQLVRRVKELRPDIKVILMTAFEISMPEFQAVLPSTLVDMLLKKPFNTSKLAETVNEVLQEPAS